MLGRVDDTPDGFPDLPAQVTPVPVWGCSGSVHSHILISCSPLAPRLKTPPASFSSKHVAHLLGQDRRLCLLKLQSSLQSGFS